MFRRTLAVAAAAVLGGAGALAAAAPAQAALPGNCSAVVIGWHAHAHCTWSGNIPWKLKGQCADGSWATSPTPTFGTGYADVFCWSAQSGDVRNLTLD